MPAGSRQLDSQTLQQVAPGHDGPTISRSGRAAARVEAEAAGAAAGDVEEEEAVGRPQLALVDDGQEVLALRPSSFQWNWMYATAIVPLARNAAAAGEQAQRDGDAARQLDDAAKPGLVLLHVAGGTITARRNHRVTPAVLSPQPRSFSPVAEPGAVGPAPGLVTSAPSARSPCQPLWCPHCEQRSLVKARSIGIGCGNRRLRIV